jgi:hypothetical protein
MDIPLFNGGDELKELCKEVAKLVRDVRTGRIEIVEERTHWTASGELRQRKWYHQSRDQRRT